MRDAGVSAAVRTDETTATGKTTKENMMSTTIEKAEVTLPSDREVQVKRSFGAPRALVYRAYTEPELVRRWLLGPPGWSMPVCEMDVRVGGRYRWRWRSDEDGSEFGFTGTFREVRPRESFTQKPTIPARWRTIFPKNDALVTVYVQRRGRCHDHHVADGLRVERGAGCGGGHGHDRRHGAELSAHGSVAGRTAASMNRWPRAISIS